MFSLVTLFYLTSQIPRAFVQETSHSLPPISDNPLHSVSVSHSEAPLHSVSVSHSEVTLHSESPPHSETAVHSSDAPHSKDPSLHSVTSPHSEDPSLHSVTSPHSEDPSLHSVTPPHSEVPLSSKMPPHTEYPLTFAPSLKPTTFPSMFVTGMGRFNRTLSPELQNATPNPSLRPLLVVFETDKLLWPFWVDIKLVKPFVKNKKGEVFDQIGRPLNLYPDVMVILKSLSKKNYTMAVASRSYDAENTKTLLELFDIAKFFAHVVVRPCDKIHQMTELREVTHVEFEDMLNFDGEAKNIELTENSGIPSILCRFGLDLASLDVGLKKFAVKKRRDLDELVL